MATEQTDDQRIPTAACKWDQSTLNYLNADYQKGLSTDFEFDFDLLGISYDLRDGIVLPSVNDEADCRNR